MELSIVDWTISGVRRSKSKTENRATDNRPIARFMARFLFHKQLPVGFYVTLARVLVTLTQ